MDLNYQNKNQIYDKNNKVHFLLNDHPEYDIGKNEYLKNHKKNPNIISESITGFLLFFLICVICIPFFLIKLNNEEILLSYLANIDLIATILSFKNGPGKIDFFKYLYLDDRPLIGYINQNLINYVVLLAVSYIIISTSVKSKIVGDGMAKVTIILIVTYLFPGRLVSEGMHYVDNILINDYKINPSISWYITFIVGVFIALFFIILEAFIIKISYKNISKLYEKYILKIINSE